MNEFLLEEVFFHDGLVGDGVAFEI